MNCPKIPTIEWQTLLILVINYAVFAIICVFYHQLHWWLVLVVGSFTVALHGSLQHEVIHGHPTRNRLVNELLIFPPLWLWLPFDLYRDSHLKHHVDHQIADPFEDPESYFVSQAQWDKLLSWQRDVYVFRNTVVGRLLLGPLMACWILWRDELLRFASGDMTNAGLWFRHLIAVALMLQWLHHFNIPVPEFLILFAYPGLALTMLRSFLEHQPAELPSNRTVVVQSGKIMGLLFLHNNLHALHHEQPALPWYRLPRVWRQSSAEILRRNGGYYYQSYLQIVKQYLFKPKVHPRHPAA